MYCIHCGKTIDDDSIFCEYCGGRVVFNVDKELTAKMIRMKCSQCNSEMEIQENELIGGMQVLVCPYCGTRAMVVQDDEVLKTNIVTAAKKEIELTKERNKKEVEMASMQTQIEQKKIDREKWQSVFIKIMSPFVFLVPGLFFFFITALWYTDGSKIAAIIPFLEGTVLVSSFLVHTFGDRTKLDKPIVISIIVLLLLMYPAVVLNSHESERETYNSTFTWDSEISAILPYPPTSTGKNNSVYGNKILDVDVYYVTAEQFSQYVQECKDYGFTIDPYTYSETSYYAFNSDGYYVTISYWKYSNQLDIELNKPEEFEKYNLTRYRLQKFLPEISSDTGRIVVDSSERFIIHVNNMTKSDCIEYIDKCLEAGFVYNYERDNSKAFFRGENEDGYKIRVEYIGFNVVSIALNEPEKDDE